MKTTYVLPLVVTICALSGIACLELTGPGSGENPEWVTKMIVGFLEEPVSNPPQSIWQYEYKGETVYYVPPICCDQFSLLFAEDGTLIGSPDGGFGGTGDGHHNDFLSLRTNGRLVWSDPRAEK
jgi:hypothetical protein